jgi:hypothetical protein
MQKSDYIHVRISPEAKVAFEKICKQEHRSQGAQIEYWISQFKLNDEKEN